MGDQPLGEIERVTSGVANDAGSSDTTRSFLGLKGSDLTAAKPDGGCRDLCLPSSLIRVTSASIYDGGVSRASPWKLMIKSGA